MLADLIDFDPASKVVSTREGKHKEFKQVFNKKAFSKYTKTIAAFSNTDGGVLIFGVADKPKRLVGVALQDFPDEAKWADRLEKDFDPEIAFSIKEYRQGEMIFVGVFVSRNIQRPVICKRTVTEKVEKKGVQKDIAVLQEGNVYYRYTGKTKPIRYLELAAILSERDERRLRSVLDNLEIMSKIGAEKVGIVDVTKSGQPGNEAKLYVSKETAKSLSFIDRANLVEEEGAPAYVVAGTVQINEVVERRIPDEEKVLPREAASQILPVLKQVFGDDIIFKASHLAKLSKGLGIRDANDSNERYFIYDKKFKRSYYRAAGVEHILASIQENPIDCLKMFGSRKTIEKYCVDDEKD